MEKDLSPLDRNSRISFEPFDGGAASPVGDVLTDLLTQVGS
jgi:hypothetical protein